MGARPAAPGQRKAGRLSHTGARGLAQASVIEGLPGEGAGCGSGSLSRGVSQGNSWAPGAQRSHVHLPRLKDTSGFHEAEQNGALLSKQGEQ